MDIDYVGACYGTQLLLFELFVKELGNQILKYLLANVAFKVAADQDSRALFRDENREFSRASGMTRRLSRFPDRQRRPES